MFTYYLTALEMEHQQKSKDLQGLETFNTEAGQRGAGRTTALPS